MQTTGTLAKLAAAIVIGTATTAAGAVDTLRCGRSLVDPGMTAAEVESRCGRPDARDVEQVPIRSRTRSGASIEVGVTTVEHWTYERGRQLPARLTFEDGRLERIELLTGR